ncbi:hypothetical protein C3B55_00463 [Candidatus Pseudomonas adelgestsugas]|uniref:Uncharacterized protein n=1 Tax=Candidatus Pseudomonas adelgestsugas TaxID=1302376 RepID=A0ABX5R8C2_9PSED|nr:hypothetical protein C3B55_00463 [Candidatus Pseudomonas adelgestsugas]
MKFYLNQLEHVDISPASLIYVILTMLLLFIVTITFTRKAKPCVDLSAAMSNLLANSEEIKQLDISISTDRVFSVNDQMPRKQIWLTS